ncbi:hypothetical protein EGW08_017448 [Elysia chlorotica]|uniref:Uncharacterized protein n=1 Tax=Elysia chlorotica TaxID=188477 RepID=A0A3S1BTW9_ELYCH|nr:hypothetical protein EGW08_017448 [Elysia chlorotica]
MGDRGTAEACGCELCQHHSEHIRRRDETRAAYKMDAGRTDDQEIITPVDLQKVMMLPRLPGLKSCAFTKRIVVFNETFAGLGTSSVNSHDISANEITFKYLETGHTFMAADSVHQSIKRQLKKCGDVRDFQEYADSLEKARCKVINMEATSFKLWKDHSNRANLNKGGHKLSNVAVVQFRRGSRLLFYKNTHESNTPFLTADFLKKKSNISALP